MYKQDHRSRAPVRPARAGADRAHRPAAPPFTLPRYVPAMAGDGSVEARVRASHLFVLLGRCLPQLYQGIPEAEVIEDVLRLSGELFGTGHAFYLRVSPEGRLVRELEWCASHLLPRQACCRELPIAELPEALVVSFKTYGALMMADVLAEEPGLRGCLMWEDMRAMALVPVWGEKRIIGLLGVDDRRVRHWSSAEMAALGDTGMLVSSVVNGEHTLPPGERPILARLLDHSGMRVYVGDLGTGHILWANEAVRRLQPKWNNPNACHDELWDDRVRREQLTGGGGLATYEVCELASENIYLVNDSLVYWAAGRPAHLCMALDISELRRQEKLLDRLCTIDLASGMPNRTAALAELRRHATAAGEGRLAVAVLGYMADTQVGEPTLRRTVDAVREVLRPEHFLGRYDGTRMLALLPGCRAEVAHIRMEQARHHLHCNRVPLFSFGVAQKGETAQESGADGLLQLAEARMHSYSLRHGC